jgi:hypothetical protein
METQQHAATSVPTLWDALVDLCRRVAASVDGHAAPTEWTEDVAFSDELERELIRRELHGSRI